MTPETVRRRLVVSGRVQGVWFRESCRAEAERHGVAGWVRNRPDGMVEIEAEGPVLAVAALADWAEQGPPRARVDGVESTDVPVTGTTGFEVR
jgi:acylphosphatase